MKMLSNVIPFHILLYKHFKFTLEIIQRVTDTIFDMNLDYYEEFLKQRRVLIAEKMRLYYLAL